MTKSLNLIIILFTYQEQCFFKISIRIFSYVAYTHCSFEVIIVQQLYLQFHVFLLKCHLCFSWICLLRCWQKHGISSDLAILNKWKQQMSEFLLGDSWLLFSFFIQSASYGKLFLKQYKLGVIFPQLFVLFSEGRKAACFDSDLVVCVAVVALILPPLSFLLAWREDCSWSIRSEDRRQSVRDVF